MGMSTNVVGIKPQDATWKKMKKVYDACIEAGVDAPEEVATFFGDEPPDEKGVIVDLEVGHGVVSQWEDESRSGLEVNLELLPKDIKILRFYNGW